MRYLAIEHVWACNNEYDKATHSALCATSMMKKNILLVSMITEVLLKHIVPMLLLACHEVIQNSSFPHEIEPMPNSNRCLNLDLKQHSKIVREAERERFKKSKVVVPWAYRRKGSLAFGEAHWRRRKLPRKPPRLDLCASASWTRAPPVSSRTARTQRAATSSTLPFKERRFV